MVRNRRRNGQLFDFWKKNCECFIDSWRHTTGSDVFGHGEDRFPKIFGHVLLHQSLFLQWKRCATRAVIERNKFAVFCLSKRRHQAS